METKVVLFIIHLTLGIISSIIYLIYCYKKYEVLTLADIIASLLILFGWPYVIDKLIEDKKLSTNSLLGAVSKVCSEEQFNNILSILIETPIPCTDVPISAIDVYE